MLPRQSLIHCRYQTRLPKPNRTASRILNWIFVDVKTALHLRGTKAFRNNHLHFHNARRHRKSKKQNMYKELHFLKKELFS